MEETKEQQNARVIEHTYEALFKNMLNAFALHKIIVDDQGKPIDYEFIDVNASFEEMTGLKKADIIGQPVTKIIPGILHDKANWIERYGKIAHGGEGERFDEHSESLGKWFHVYAYSPMTDYFATIFYDITLQKKSEIALKEKVEELEKINKLMVGREIDMIKMKEELSKYHPDTTV